MYFDLTELDRLVYPELSIKWNRILCLSQRFYNICLDEEDYLEVLSYLKVESIKVLLPVAPAEILISSLYGYFPSGSKLWVPNNSLCETPYLRRTHNTHYGFATVSNKRTKNFTEADRKRYRKENPDKVLQSVRKYRRKYLSKFQEYDRVYRQLHKEKRRIQNRESEKRRALKDPSFKIRKSLSNSIYCALVRNKSTKNNLSILKYLPYTMQELKQHIEKQFEPWMSWNNWGIYDPKNWNDQDSSTWTWQIDHIVPHGLFYYTSMEDENFKKCWALENLRPYSAKNNCMENVPEKRIKK